MALQFQRFMLASSPPAFELLSCNWIKKRMSGRLRVDGESSNDTVDSRSDSISCRADQNAPKPRKEYEFRDERLVTTRDKELDKKRILEWTSAYDCNLEDCKGHFNDFKVSRRRQGRKVLFADDFGKEIAEVRTASEPTEVPPILKPETIEKIEKSLPGFCLEHRSDEVRFGSTFNLELLNFVEPHSDLMALHNKVERSDVALSTLSARQDMKLGGTVEIKDRSQRSEVFLRFTTDRWKTFEDVAANYATLVGGTDHVQYAFEFKMPRVEGHEVQVEFALCYQSKAGRNFECWDNNCGQNYKVLCSDCQTVSQIFSGSPGKEKDAQIHRTLSAPGELNMWGMPELENNELPYW